MAIHGIVCVTNLFQYLRHLQNTLFRLRCPISQAPALYPLWLVLCISIRILQQDTRSTTTTNPNNAGSGQPANKQFGSV